ncbi:MAG TPA: L,D-transpeptidase [Hyphomicrobiaceae bacterium]|nr:L,D-transpeptidase [Hyphomicrobiaceae bacterium]
MLTRRHLIYSAALTAVAGLTIGWTKSRRVPFGTSLAQMKPGDYSWAPDRSTDGAMVVIVSIPEQRAYVYRHGTLMAVTTCSTGRKGHNTPAGVFTVLQKDADHVSSTYKGAKMPYMERLTWSGIALHAGNLPGYPASHGCIRLPLDFARLLFSISHLGIAVIIADEHSQPVNVVHPGLVLSSYAKEEARAKILEVSQKKLPPQRRHQHGHRPAKVLISVADRKVMIFEDGHLRAVGPLTIKNSDVPIGSHTFVLKSADAQRGVITWTAVGYHLAGSNGRLMQPETAVLDRLSTDSKTSVLVHKLMHPGLTIVITDDPAPDTTRSSRSFVIATHHEPEDWQTRVLRQ